MRARSMLMILLPLAGLLILLFSALRAEKPDENSSGAAGSISPTETSAPTTQQKQDSLFALLDQEFGLVKPIFEHSCYDCHSNSTHYPWYHSIPVIKGMIDKDIVNARRHADFSDGFPFKGKPPILQILRDIKEEIKEGDMPPWDYRMMHWGRLIEGTRQDSVINWLDSSIVRIEKFYDAEKIPYEKETPKDSSMSGD